MILIWRQAKLMQQKWKIIVLQFCVIGFGAFSDDGEEI